MESSRTRLSRAAAPSMRNPHSQADQLWSMLAPAITAGPATGSRMEAQDVGFSQRISSNRGAK